MNKIELFKIPDLCNEELYVTAFIFKDFCTYFRLNIKESKVIYSSFYKEAQKRGLNNFPIFEELL